MGRGSMAKLCQKCSSGSNANKCIVCGERISGEGAIARICDSCGFGSKKNKCVECGKSLPIFGKSTTAMLALPQVFNGFKERHLYSLRKKVVNPSGHEADTCSLMSACFGKYKFIYY